MEKTLRVGVVRDSVSVRVGVSVLADVRQNTPREHWQEQTQSLSSSAQDRFTVCKISASAEALAVRHWLRNPFNLGYLIRSKIPWIVAQLAADLGDLSRNA